MHNKERYLKLLQKTFLVQLHCYEYNSKEKIFPQEQIYF